jgi:hypothetical protein
LVNVKLVVHIVTTGLKEFIFELHKVWGIYVPAVELLGSQCGLRSEQPIKYDARRGHLLKSSLEKQGEGRGRGALCKIVHKFKNGPHSYVSKRWLF